MNSGIYTITNTKNGHRYVGSAVDLKDRFRCHRQRLCRGKHRNAHLQRAWNKYGEDAFEFEVLEHWEPEFLISMEQWWMNMLHPEYNIAPVAGSNLGMKFGPPSEEHIAKLRAASTGKRHSKKTIAKMRKSQKGRTFSDESIAKMRAAATGRKHTDEACAKMSATRRGLVRSQVHEIRHLLALGDMLQKEIAEYFPVGRTMISDINRGYKYASW